METAPNEHFPPPPPASPGDRLTQIQPHRNSPRDGITGRATERAAGEMVLRGREIGDTPSARLWGWEPLPSPSNHWWQIHPTPTKIPRPNHSKPLLMTFHSYWLIWVCCTRYICFKRSLSLKGNFCAALAWGKRRNEPRQTLYSHA